MSGYQLAGGAPAAYSRYALKVMGTWTDELIQAARCQDGDRVLDIACGTGIVASRVNLVSGQFCTVTGIDINEGMLNVARANAAIDWHLGSATDLPFQDGQFDVVLCQQGLQYFPNRPAAVREMARVLAPGGRVALCVWGALERQPFQSAIINEIGATLGADAKALFDMAFSLHSAEEPRRLARDAGLTDIKVRFAHRTMRYPVPAGMVEGFLLTTPVAGQFLALPEDGRRAFVARVVAKLADHIDDGGLAAAQENHFLTASKPG